MKWDTLSSTVVDNDNIYSRIKVLPHTNAIATGTVKSTATKRLAYITNTI